MAEFAAVRAAATVVALRRSAPTSGTETIGATTVFSPARSLSNFEVLLVQRRASARFLPGCYVFPGGVVERDCDDVSDDQVAFSENQDFTLIERARSQSFERQYAPACVWRDGKLYINEAFDDLAEVGNNAAPNSEPRWVSEASFRQAAVRELFEEAGILLATKPITDVANALAVHSTMLSTPTTVSSFRKEVQEDASAFRRVLGTVADCEPDPSVLHPIAWLLTPRFSGGKWRYSTLFYVAEVDEAQHGMATWDQHETQRLVWIAPRDALDAAENGEMHLVEPTRRMLERLTHYASVDALLNELSESSFGEGPLGVPPLPYPPHSSL